MNTPKITTCWRCDASMEWTRTDRCQIEPRFCAPCKVIEIDRLYQDVITKAETSLLSHTPARYQATDIMHSDFNRRLWERAQSWKPTAERPWLGLVGPTGESKTRCAFLILRKITLEMIRRPDEADRGVWRPSIAIVSGHRFAEAVMAQFDNDRKFAAVAFLRSLQTADILMIDDLGKQRNTPAVSSELFALLDHRHAENLTTIWTANSTPEGIVMGMSEDLSAPLAGRIRECSTIINLS